MPLSRKQTRVFTVAFMVMLFGLAILATVLITRGWSDPELQRRVEAMEERRR